MSGRRVAKTVDCGVSNAPRIGVVTVLFKSAVVIDAFVRCMNLQTFKNFHVYFVQNEIADTACGTCVEKSAHFEYTFVRDSENVGIATGNNQGIDFFMSDVRYTHILFINNDVEFLPSFLEDQIQLFTKYKKIDALAPKVFYYSDPTRIWYAGGELSYLKGGVRHFGHNKRDKLIGREIYPVNFAPACSLIVKLSTLRDVGIRMWDELFVYADDYQFCRDLRAAHVNLYYAPAIRMWHKVSSSTGGRRSDFSRFYVTRNWAYLGLVHRNVVVVGLMPVLRWWWGLHRRDIELRALDEARQMARERRGRRGYLH